MNKKNITKPLLATVISLSLMTAPAAQAGFAGKAAGVVYNTSATFGGALSTFYAVRKLKNIFMSGNDISKMDVVFQAALLMGGTKALKEGVTGFVNAFNQNANNDIDEDEE